MAEVTLVLGAARSGKSAYAPRAAEACAARTGGELVFVATVEALDARWPSGSHTIAKIAASAGAP